jgi:quercetin dioxygenase-like cupin family protein
MSIRNTSSASVAIAVAGLYASTASLSMADQTTADRATASQPAASKPTASHSAAAGPDVLFSNALPDLPGRRIVVVALEFDPKAGKHFTPHRHPGSVYVYVTKGSVRLGIAGQPAKLVHAGESFFEPAGALHTVGESASATEPASAIAVLIVPEGAPLLTVDAPKK